MSIGILTSGGDAPGMNAAIRAAFRAIKMREPDREIIFFRDGFNGLAGKLDTSTDRNVDRTKVRGIVHRGGTFLGSGRVEELKLPDPNAPDYEDRLAAREDFLRVAAVNLFQMHVDALIVIGGDGSFRGASVICEHFKQTFPKRPFRVVGIPATIDNDLYGTDYTIGFDTALNNIVDAIRKIRFTVESHKRGIILEVMGNESGWLAMQSAIAGGASVAIIPEFPDMFEHEAIIERVMAGLERDYRYFIIVVAEGVRRIAGRDWSRDLREAMETHAGMRRILGRPMEVRINSVGHVARGGQPSAFDNTLASRYGAAAAEVIQLGECGGEAAEAGDLMVGLRGNRMQTVPLHDVVAHSPTHVTRDSELFQLSELLMLQKDQPF